VDVLAHNVRGWQASTCRLRIIRLPQSGGNEAAKNRGYALVWPGDWVFQRGRNASPATIMTRPNRTHPVTRMVSDQMTTEATSNQRAACGF